MEMEESGRALTETDFSEMEKQFKLKLPQDYKVFMLEHNGGTPKDNLVFDFVETGTSHVTNSVISYFEVIYPNETAEAELDDLKAGYAALVESGQIPPSLLPIADDVFGNIILMCVSEQDYGKVCFANHELADPETGYMVTSLIADSFSEFISKCYVQTDE